MKRHSLQDCQGLLKQALQIDMMIKGIQPTLSTRDVWFGLSDLVAKIAR